ncbi:MAG: 50S ribosomal protein L23 [Deltaproteobacteria bacterium]|nr:50S ribosomal protein L23 [Deltaproteobacteria bacterium]
MSPEQVIKRPIILTEKSRLQQEDQNQFAFEVDRRANKIEIRNAVQSLFKVTVTDVNTLVIRGKMRRMGRGVAKTQNWKKAIVTLKAGDSIKFFQGTEE